MRKYSMITIMSLFLAFGLVLPVYAGSQSVTFTPDNLTILPGESGNLALVYDVPEGDAKTTGIGVRVFFNSNVFESVAFENIYGVGLVSNDEVAQDDVDDQDNDPMTDKFVGIAWVSLMGNWPNLVELPMELADLVLTPYADKAVAPVTVLNVKAIDTAEGYAFTGGSVQITIP